MLAPDSSPESYILPTRPARQPAPYAYDTLPGVTPPSGPRLISVCIQPSPWARRSMGVVERDGSHFLRPDPPPSWGRRGSGTFSTSHECPPSVTPTRESIPAHRPSILKRRSMNPSLLGWYSVVLVLCIPNRRHTSSTTLDPKFVPWSLCSSRKAPYRTTISNTNFLATVVAF